MARHGALKAEENWSSVARSPRRGSHAVPASGPPATWSALWTCSCGPGDPALTTYEGVLPGFTARVKLTEDEKPWLSWLRRQGLDFADRDAAHRPVGALPGTISNAPPAYSADQTQTAFLADEFIRWLGEQDAPWFAHVSFLRPHPPFSVPEPYNRMFSAADGPAFARAAAPETFFKSH